jgi:O-antigen/teichoic acid export membrane protein
MNAAITLIRRFGWQPSGQAIIVLLSFASFAALSRLLGPSPYAQFAVYLFVYTIVGIVTDFSAMNYVLVHGPSSRVLQLARRSALASACSGVLLIAVGFLLLTALSKLLPAGAPNLDDGFLLAAGIAAQALLGVPRALMLTAGMYRSTAVTDVVSSILGFAASIATAAAHPDVTALVVQVAVTAVARVALSAIIGRKALAATAAEREAGDTDLDPRSALRFAARLIPVNAASYISRSLDSALLPLILPAATAASYVRSYQFIVVPTTQLQIALGGVILERMANAKRVSTEALRAFERRLWRLVSSATFLAGCALSLLSSLIVDVFFGSGWPHAATFIAAMACLLPALTQSTFVTWKLQLEGNKRHSIVTFAILVMTPLLATVLALAFGYEGALLGLVLGAVLQSIALIALLPGLSPLPSRRMALEMVGQWAVLVGLLLVRELLT